MSTMSQRARKAMIALAAGSCGLLAFAYPEWRSEAQEEDYEPDECSQAAIDARTQEARTALQEAQRSLDFELFLRARAMEASQRNPALARSATELADEQEAMREEAFDEALDAALANFRCAAQQ